MWCKYFQATISSKSCIQRQKLALQATVTAIVKVGENGLFNKQQLIPESFVICSKCEQGKRIQKEKGDDSDVHKLLGAQLEKIRSRGFIHKEENIHDFEALRLTGNIERAELNYIEGRYNTNLSIINKNAIISIKRRKLNGKGNIKIITGTGSRALYDRTIRIIRYLYKQGYFTRGKQGFLQSIRVYFTDKAGKIGNIKNK